MWRNTNSFFQKHYLIITCLRWQQKLRWSRNYPHFAEPINSLPPSQQSFTSPYRTRQTNIVHSQPSYFFNINFNIIIPSTTRSYNRRLTVMSSNKNPTCQGCKKFFQNTQKSPQNSRHQNDDMQQATYWRHQNDDMQQATYWRHQNDDMQQATYWRHINIRCRRTKCCRSKFATRRFVFIVYLLHAACPAHLTFLDLVILVIFEERYQSWRFPTALLPLQGASQHTHCTKNVTMNFHN